MKNFPSRQFMGELLLVFQLISFCLMFHVLRHHFLFRPNVYKKFAFHSFFL